MTTLVHTLILDYDLVEVHYNSLLNNKPYLVRVFNYDNDPVELRLNKEETDNLYQILKDNDLL